jgi:hypothetical protein
MLRLSLLMLCLCSTYGTEVPDWVLVGIAYTESRSYYSDTGLVWVDHTRGRAGERGPYQCTYRAWKDVSRRGERFSDLERDTKYAEQVCIRYLLRVYNGNWDQAIMSYNAGPGNRSVTYLRLVKRHARLAGYKI